MIRLNKINDEKVRPIPLNMVGSGDDRPILGSNLFSEIYANIFLCAKKKSGKTSVIYKILKGCANKESCIIAFVSTLYKDDNWKAIQQWAENKDIPFIGHTSIVEDGVDKLKQLVHDLQEQDKFEENLDKDDEEPKDKIILLNDDTKEAKETVIKPKRSKYRSPEYIFVFDDLSTELKNRNLVALMKKNRHFKCKIIISSQYLFDLLPESRKQLDYFLVFKGQSLPKLKDIYSNADIGVDFDKFKKIYEYATKKPYSFLYIDTVRQQFRRNFNTDISVEEENA